ncbi:MAG TPA: acetolactate synthase [Lachnospiraceae bacterium]|nr:acetolactate synthase [Lachnospiraceae bacterium]
MTVKQISVFVENTAGKLAEFTEVLCKHNINMRALSLADTRDFGILRLIVDDSYTTACVLKEENYVFSITKVLAVAIPDEPGSLNKILGILGKNGINIEYTYAFNHKSQGMAYMIFRVEDNEKAIEVLNKEGIKIIDQDHLHEI